MKKRAIILPIVVILGAVMGSLCLPILSVARAVVTTRFPDFHYATCLAHAMYDLNGNGIADPGDIHIDGLNGLLIQVTDSDGPDSGVYSFYDCRLRPTVKARTIHLHVIVPRGYVATSTTDMDVFVLNSIGYYDYPPRQGMVLLNLDILAPFELRWR